MATPPDQSSGGIRKRSFVVPAVVTSLVLISALFAVVPIADAVTGGAVPGARLELSTAYVLLGPLSAILDTLTLLDESQHFALAGGVLLLLMVSWAAGRRSGRRALWLFVFPVIVGMVVYASVLWLDRPMASLRIENPDVIVVDFHSHTDASHDGYQTVEESRVWHRRAGYHLAFITDHGTLVGAERGVARNPRVAGAGMTFLESVEVRWNGEHVSIPWVREDYSGLLSPDSQGVSIEGMAAAGRTPGSEPIVIWNHPRFSAEFTEGAPPAIASVRALELVNGSPRDATRMRRRRSEIIRFAEARNLPLTSGSDSHGWGRTTPAWTLMPIPGWRGMTPDSLSDALQGSLRSEGIGATRIVERRIANPAGDPVMIASTILAVPWRMLTALSLAERISWLAWTWVLWGLGRMRRKRSAGR